MLTGSSEAVMMAAPGRSFSSSLLSTGSAQEGRVEIGIG